MTDLIKGLIEYFEETPKDVLKKELAELEKFNTFGPEVSLYLEATEMRQCEFISVDEALDEPSDYNYDIQYSLAA